MHDSTIIQTSYDLRLVGLSVLIAIFASYAALDLSARVAAARQKARMAWLLGGAVAMGTGVWSMHYTGMLAYRLPIPVYYHIPTVLLSLVAAIAASFVALFVVSREHLGVLHVSLGSVLMAAGIATMHYTGMAAMRLSAMHQWDTTLVTASIAVAWMVSLAGLGLIKLNLVLSSGPDKGSWLATVSAVTMGLAIPGMHYTAMAAVSYTTMHTTPDLTNAVDISALANTAIIIITLIVLGSVFLVRWWPTLIRPAVRPQSKGVAHS